MRFGEVSPHSPLALPTELDASPRPRPHFRSPPPPVRQVPSPWTIAGGGLLLGTLVVHECTGRSGGRTLPTRETPNLPPPSPLPTTISSSWDVKGQRQRSDEEDEDRPYYYRIEGGAAK